MTTYRTAKLESLPNGDRVLTQAPISWFDKRDYKTVKTERIADGTVVLTQRLSSWAATVWSRSIIWGWMVAFGSFFLALFISGFLTSPQPACVNGWCPEVSPPHWALVFGLATTIAIAAVWWVGLGITVLVEHVSTKGDRTSEGSP